MPDPNTLLAQLRTYLESARLFAEDHDGAADVPSLASAAHYADQLDAHLSAGGAAPTAWSEGPDAVGQDPWGWQDDERQPPEHFDVFAHWSKVHDGVNVEIDVPNGLRVTVHFNEWLAVDSVAGVGTNNGDPLPAGATPGTELERAVVEGELIEHPEARLLRDRLPGARGHQALYELVPPLANSEWDNDAEDFIERLHRFVVVSAADVPYSGPETYLFPADETGEITSYGELPGSLRGVLDHDAALARAGYTVIR